MNSTINLANLAKENTMKQVNMLEAKTDLSKLVKLLEDKEEDYILIARNGKTVAKLVPISNDVQRIGIAKGKLLYDGNFDELNDEIAAMFGVE